MTDEERKAAELEEALRFGLQPDELREKRAALLRGEPLVLPPLRRSYTLERKAVNEEARTVELTFSSEREVDRWFGIEILDHDERSVNLDRLRSGGAVLVNHDAAKQVGVVETVKIGGDRRGRAVVRFGRSAFAEEIFQDVKDGIRTQVSTGYRIHKVRAEKGPAGERGAQRVRATSWEPLEISFEPVSEDYTIGVGRAAGEEGRRVIVEGIETREASAEPSAVTNEQPDTREGELTPDEIKAKLDSERKAEKDRATAILTVGEKTGHIELARQYIQEDRSLSDFQTAVLDLITTKGGDGNGAGTGTPAQVVTRSAPEGEKKDEGNPAFLGLGEKDLARYSVRRAILAYLDGNWKGAGLEEETHNAILQRTGRAANGFFVPNDVLADPRFLMRGRGRDAAGAFLQLVRTLDTGASPSGGPLVGTDHLAGSFIEVLRNRTIAMAAGVRTLDGLVGDISIPRQTGGATTDWVTEGNGPAGLSDPSFDAVPGDPKTLATNVAMTRKLLMQSAPSVEALVRDDLANAMAIEIDRVVLRGADTGGEPQGIVGSTGVADVEFHADGAAATWDKVLEFESDVATSNADVSTMAMVTTPRGRKHLKGSPKVSGDGSAGFMWERDNTVNGYRAFATNQLRDTLAQGGGTNLTEILFGNFADALLLMWGTLDLKPDEAALAASGGLVLRAFQDVDVAVRHGGSFAYSNDLNAA